MLAKLLRILVRSSPNSLTFPAPVFIVRSRPPFLNPGLTDDAIDGEEVNNTTDYDSVAEDDSNR